MSQAHVVMGDVSIQWETELCCYLVPKLSEPNFCWYYVISGVRATEIRPRETAQICIPS